jgi:hypothetical protein
VVRAAAIAPEPIASTRPWRLHAPNEFFRIRRLGEGMRAWEELWRLLADGLDRLASREGDDG